MTLSMEKINKSFGANNVLTDVSFRLEAGEICALLGENGAGKSTLIKAIHGMSELKITGGSIVFDDTDSKYAKKCPNELFGHFYLFKISLFAFISSSKYLGSFSSSEPVINLIMFAL